MPREKRSRRAAEQDSEEEVLESTEASSSFRVESSASTRTNILFLPALSSNPVSNSASEFEFPMLRPAIIVPQRAILLPDQARRTVTMTVGLLQSAPIPHHGRSTKSAETKTIATSIMKPKMTCVPPKRS